MTRLLVCFAYFFRGLRIMPWVCGIGFAMAMFEILMPGDAAGALALPGAFLFVGFPIVVGGAFYRQLIGNRRTALVPEFRFFATGALFLLALTGGAFAAIVSTQVISPPDPWHVAQLAFAFISLYLLVSQWMVTRSATAIGFVFLPLFAFAFAASKGFGAPQGVFAPWGWLALAGLGWLWLAFTVTRQGASHRMLAVRAAASAEGPGTRGFWPSIGASLDPSGFATAAGTLMRGRGDRWSTRFNGALTMVLLMPAVMSAAAVLLASMGGDAEERPFGVVFLGSSFALACVLPKAIYGEWPARQRLLWLRVGGDRPELWRRLERALLQEIGLIAAIHIPVAAGFLVLYDVARYLCFLYLAGAALCTLTSGYAGFLARISGWSFVGQGALYFVVVMTFLIGGIALWNSTDPRAVLALLPLLLALALTFRTMARSRFRRMDWCRVRPTRFPPRVA